MTFPTSIGIDNVIEAEFPAEMTISSSPTITNVGCLAGTVTRVSDQVIQVVTSQVCPSNTQVSMIITAVKNPVSIYIFYLLCCRTKSVSQTIPQLRCYLAQQQLWLNNLSLEI